MAGLILTVRVMQIPDSVDAIATVSYLMLELSAPHLLDVVLTVNF